MSKPKRRRDLRLHDVVRHPDHKGRGEVIERVTEVSARPWCMVLVVWSREKHSVAWVAPERCELVKGQRPKPRRNRALLKRIARAARR